MISQHSLRVTGATHTTRASQPIALLITPRVAFRLDFAGTKNAANSMAHSPYPCGCFSIQRQAVATISSISV